jgi:hypothetical protein
MTFKASCRSGAGACLRLKRAWQHTTIYFIN